MLRKILFLSIALGFLPPSAPAAEPAALKILFLGDSGHHKPYERFRNLEPILAKRNIALTYTDKADDLSAENLKKFDGLIVYANIDEIKPAQEKALLDFVAGGKGFIPLHCASFCFRNSNAYVELVGAQFQRHDTGIFRTQLTKAEHPILGTYQPFESWDETYVHTKHNDKDRTVLETRTEGSKTEPWTWVRTHGKGRVFYTAWGHDERTWSNAGFHNLVERGIRWACAQDPSLTPAYRDRPQMTPIAKDVKPFEYVDAKIPFYPPTRGASREPLSKMQKPLPPEESMKHVSHPVGFELKLFVSEKELGGKPICMNWDERGRLWVAITMDYPNELQPSGKGRDRIVIVEDTDGDGVADKVTTFADKLSIPTSFTFANGGIIVHQAPDTLFLKDTNGDGVADERKVLFSGWNTSDTHAGPSNLKPGFDNWIYGMVGYAGFDGVVGGERKSFRTGFYRFKSDGSKIEFLRNTNNNSWGVGFSEDGLLFGSTANGCPSVYLPIPNRYYEGVRGWTSSVLQNIAFENRFQPITDKVRQVDWHGGFTSAAGHSLYTARTYPKEYWNRTAFVSDPTGHLTATFLLQQSGTDFRSRYGWNLVAGDDEWFAPISAEVGPDGNMWIIDWYAFIVQHNPTPQGFTTGKGNAYETELRDKKHGRIYRLVNKNAKAEPPVTLKDASPEKLVETLKNPNMFWRQHAQRLLVERGKKDVVPALIKLAKDQSVDEIGLNVGAIHAIWTLSGLNAVDPKVNAIDELAWDALEHPSPAVARNMLLAFPKTPDSRGWYFCNIPYRSEDLQVRMAAFLALADFPKDTTAARHVLAGLTDPKNMVDRWLPDALTIAGAAHDEPFLIRLASSGTALGDRALQVVAIVAEHYARGGPAKSVGKVLAELPRANGNVREVILAAFAKAWPKSQPADLDDTTEKTLADLLGKLSPAGKGSLVKLATAWNSKALSKYGDEIAAGLLKSIGDEKEKDEQRLASARQYAEMKPLDEKGVAALLAAITPQSSPQLAVGLIEAVGTARGENSSAALLKRFPSFSPAARAAALRVLLSRPQSARALLDAIEKGEVQFTELSLDQKQFLASHDDAKIAAAAKKLLAAGGGLPNADRVKVIEELLSVTKKTGNATQGKEMFLKHCAVCHTHGKDGNKVGPDLTGMAVHPKEELLVHILDPSRSVEGNYRLYKVILLDGKQMEGMLVSESKTSVELIDPQGKKHALLREDIEKLTGSNKSLMPEGFEKQMKPDELTNLLEFLTQRGKYLPIPIEKVATAVSTKGMFIDEKSTVERLVFADWKPKTFEDVPFVLVDPQGDKAANVILLYGPSGTFPPKMPKSVMLPCNSPAKAIHFLSGVSGWGSPFGKKETVSMIVRLHYDDGKTEDHELKNGLHFADYIRRVDVPESKFAFSLRGQQIRYLAVTPKREATIAKIELVKGPDDSAPVVMAVTVETK